MSIWQRSFATGGQHREPIAEEGATTQDTEDAFVRSKRILLRCAGVIIRGIPIGNPFLNIASHVQCSIGACTLRMASNGNRVPNRKVIVQLGVVCNLVAPRIGATLCATR